jgi:hypothetical protein
MRWGRKHEAVGADSALPQSGNGYWASQLAGIGYLLDGSGTPLSGLALSVTGEQVEVSALELGGSQYHVGWSPVTATLGAIPDAPGAGHVPGEWERSLVAVGRRLDTDSRHVADPLVLATGSGFLVTALTPSPAGRELATWTLTTEEISR